MKVTTWELTEKDASGRKSETNAKYMVDETKIDWNEYFKMYRYSDD